MRCLRAEAHAARVVMAMVHAMVHGSMSCQWTLRTGCGTLARSREPRCLLSTELVNPRCDERRNLCMQGTMRQTVEFKAGGPGASLKVLRSSWLQPIKHQHFQFASLAVRGIIGVGCCQCFQEVDSCSCICMSVVALGGYQGCYAERGTEARHRGGRKHVAGIATTNPNGRQPNPPKSPARSDRNRRNPPQLDPESSMQNTSRQRHPACKPYVPDTPCDHTYCMYLRHTRMPRVTALISQSGARSLPPGGGLSSPGAGEPHSHIGGCDGCGGRGGGRRGERQMAGGGPGSGIEASTHHLHLHFTHAGGGSG